jgi:fructokinase
MKTSAEFRKKTGCESANEADRCAALSDKALDQRSGREVDVPLYGGIEAGGTHFVCAVGTGPDDLHAEMTFPTTLPEETLGQAIDFFRRAKPIAAVGVGSFGPVDLNPNSPSHGFITNTPKPGWAETDFAGTIERALGVPVAFDTDVNTAALGEGRWGAARGLRHFLYLTVGTGIGGGAMVEGELLHGLMHPEMGHIRIPHELARDPFAGSCPYHGDCLEGLASGAALLARWGQRAETLGPDHPAWDRLAHDLALGLVSFVYILSPQRIIMGGGVMKQPALLPRIRREMVALLNGYAPAPAILEGIDGYVVPPGLGSRAGVLGAMALAERKMG